jgi:hypothetical protein
MPAQTRESDRHGDSLDRLHRAVIVADSRATDPAWGAMTIALNLPAG